MKDADQRAFERFLDEKDARNRDNVARTTSYLELYAFSRERGVELPWILMAHLVSRNAGYLMTDLGVALREPDNVFTADATRELFCFLERANYLIFHDAWHHMLHHLLGRTSALGDETPRFMRDAWGRYESALARGLDAALERSLVLDLVHNEQNLIESRVVHHARFDRARAMVVFFEGVGREAPIVLPKTDARITVGGFVELARRIDTGRRIFDTVLAPRSLRDEIFAWAMAHPHTGSRSAYTQKTRHQATLRDVWKDDAVRASWPGIHAPPEPDPRWP
jgi:hypothetical protein